MYKYALFTVSILFISSIAYAISSQETIEERVERENRETLMECLDNAGKKSTTQEILQAKNDCSESILTKIIIPITNTWTHSTGTTVLPPKWVKKGIADIAEKKSPTKSIKASSWAGVQSGTHTESVKENQFWTTYDLAIPLIRKYEWLALKAYPDPKLCSIWYWTRAKSCSEVITQAEADKRLWSIVKQLVTRVQRDFPTLSSKQQAWLVSFAFNCEKWYRDVKKRWLSKHKYWCRTASWVQLQWLINRRLEEQILIFEN